MRPGIYATMYSRAYFEVNGSCPSAKKNLSTLTRRQIIGRKVIKIRTLPRFK